MLPPLDLNCLGAYNHNEDRHRVSWLRSKEKEKERRRKGKRKRALEKHRGSDGYRASIKAFVAFVAFVAFTLVYSAAVSLLCPQNKPSINDTPGGTYENIHGCY